MTRVCLGGGAGERYMLLGIAMSWHCLCGGQEDMGGARARATCCWGSPWAGTVCAAGKQPWAGARGEKQLGNGAGRHCVCAAGEKHVGGGASTWAGTACVRVRAAGEKHMGGGASP